MFKSTHSIRRSIPGHMGGRPRPANDCIGFCRVKSGEKYSICISIPHHVVEEARLIKGDRIDVLVDYSARKIMLKRVTVDEDGTKLGWKSFRSKGERCLRIKYHPFLGCVNIHKEKRNATIKHCIVTKEGIVFDMPESLVLHQ